MKNCFSSTPFFSKFNNSNLWSLKRFPVKYWLEWKLLQFLQVVAVLLCCFTVLTPKHWMLWWFVGSWESNWESCYISLFLLIKKWLKVYNFQLTGKSNILWYQTLLEVKLNLFKWGNRHDALNTSFDVYIFFLRHLWYTVDILWKSLTNFYCESSHIQSRFSSRSQKYTLRQEIPKQLLSTLALLINWSALY